MHFSFKFIGKKYDEEPISKDYLIELEKKYGFEFPEILKKYYLECNSYEIKMCEFRRYGVKFRLRAILSLKLDGSNGFEFRNELTRKLGVIPNSYVPFAVDTGSNCFYWNTENNKVYYIASQNVKHPQQVFDSVYEFFEQLNACHDGRNKLW